MRRLEFVTFIIGVVAGLPFAAIAQQTAPVIGFLHSGSPGPFARAVDVFRQALRESGYVEGLNVTIEYRWAEGQYDRLPALAADLVGRRVSVITAVAGNAPAKAAKAATTSIPIVFVSGGDPVSGGLVASLNRPGGNLTGISVLNVEVLTKRLEVLLELVPTAKLIAYLDSPTKLVTGYKNVRRAHGRERRRHATLIALVALPGATPATSCLGAFWTPVITARG